jgi:hypothetical protein
MSREIEEKQQGDKGGDHEADNASQRPSSTREASIFFAILYEPKREISMQRICHSVSNSGLGGMDSKIYCSINPPVFAAR